MAAVTATFRTLYVFIVMQIGSHQILHQNVTAQPTVEWTLQKFREVLPGDHPYGFVIHDRPPSNPGLPAAGKMLFTMGPPIGARPEGCARKAQFSPAVARKIDMIACFIYFSPPLACLFSARLPLRPDGRKPIATMSFPETDSG